ncbi:MAG: DUF3302 domain-containing protein [Hyphomicrobiaceae bacterium]
MSGLDIFAIVVLIILFAAALAIWIGLAMLPGKIAHDRDHPQAAAINVGGWVGALFGGILWPIFLIWAFTKPIHINMDTGSDTNVGDMQKRLEAIEALQKRQAQRDAS